MNTIEILNIFDVLIDECDLDVNNVIVHNDVCSNDIFDILTDEDDHNVDNTKNHNDICSNDTFALNGIKRHNNYNHETIDSNLNRGLVRSHKRVRRGKKKVANGSSNIKIAFNNVRGCKSKKYDINRFVDSNHINVLGMAETFLKDKENISIQGYNWIGKNRPTDIKKSQGGIGFLIKDNIVILDDNVLDTRSDEYERFWIKLRITDSPDSVYFMAVAYFPCEGTNRTLTDELYVSFIRGS